MFLINKNLIISGKKGIFKKYMSVKLIEQVKMEMKL